MLGSRIPIVRFSWTPKVCKMMAFMAIMMFFFCIPLGLRQFSSEEAGSAGHEYASSNEANPRRVLNSCPAHVHVVDYRTKMSLNPKPLNPKPPHGCVLSDACQALPTRKYAGGKVFSVQSFGLRVWDAVVGLRV